MKRTFCLLKAIDFRPVLDKPKPKPNNHSFALPHLVELVQRWLEDVVEDPEDGGTSGRRRARLRLSSAPTSASCWAEKAGSADLKAVKKAPAMAEEVIRPDVLIDDMVTLFGRFWMERRKMGFVGLVRLLVLSWGLMVFKHLALRIAMVAAAGID